MAERLTVPLERWEQLQEEYDLPEGFVTSVMEDSSIDAGEVAFLESEREIIASSPSRETIRTLSSIAHLVSSSDEIYKFAVEEMDVWNSSLSLEELRERFRAVLPDRYPAFEDWLQRVYERQHVFRITKAGMHYVLKASSAERMAWARENDAVADHLSVDLNETTSQIAMGSKERAAIKKELLKKGYPVEDDYAFREVDESIGVELTCELRDYQKEMLAEAWDCKACVLANPSGSGKTVTAIGMIARADAPTLILVPQRSLIPQWRSELLDKTTLSDDQIGEYHGDTKEFGDITIATYHSAAQRAELFQQDWGLIVFDEVHHIPSKLFRRTANLQSVRRIGLSASPVREDSKENDIFTLIGPEIGGDWGLFFDDGRVLKPDVTIHFVPWAAAVYRDRYRRAEGIMKHIVASKNPAKHRTLSRLLDETDGKQIVFCDWIEQAQHLSMAFDIPHLTGETDHDRREAVLDRFRSGDIQRLIITRIGDEGLDIPDAEVCIVMSGQGGSRRQATQRAGRVMRPTGGADVHFIATKGSTEEDFVRRQMELLKEKGITVHVNDTVADSA